MFEVGGDFTLLLHVNGQGDEKLLVFSVVCCFYGIWNYL